MEKLGINLDKSKSKTALYIWNGQKVCESIKYSDLWQQISIVNINIKLKFVPKESTIGICSNKSYSLIALTLGILESNHSFCYLLRDEIENNSISYLDDFNVKYFFSDSQLCSNNIELIITETICDKTIYLYKSKSTKEVETFKDAGDGMNKICYTVKTTGTTGVRKKVRVTFNSIASNIKGMQKIFKLNESDIILSSAPITFDVFIVDMILAFSSGAALMIIPDDLRFDAFVYEKVTFVQMTPTNFLHYGLDDIKNKIMHAKSSLKYLLLGGEKFPSTQEVLTWQDWNDNNRKRIFNIYGLTEMSCWSLIHEVTKDDLHYGKIPIGIPIDNETAVAFYPHNNDDDDEADRHIEELILTSSTRVNFIDESDWDLKLGTKGVFAYVTNDLIEKIDGKIFWYGRIDDIVKRFGERVDLSKIETIASEIVTSVSCILIKKRIALFYQSPDNQIEELLANHLRLKLKSYEMPDDIKRIDFLPTCDHGKVSKRKLKELYKDILKEESVKQTAEEIFLEAINQMFNLKLENPSKKSFSSSSDEPDGKRMRTNIDSTLKQIGGSSFDALRIAMKIEDKMNVVSNGLLPKLLDNQHSIKDVFSYLRDLNLKPKNSITTKPFKVIEKPLINFKNVKKYDLNKCVDSSPSICTFNNTQYITIGSHSGKIVFIDTSDLSLISEMKLNDRIECEATQYKNFILIGCYDGFLYCIDFLKNTIIWKFNSNAMIKSKPLVMNDEFIMFGNYNNNENLRCIYYDDKTESVEVKWSKLLGASGIIANLLSIENTIVVCTLDGTCERLKIDSGKSIWTKKFDYPIFSSPQKIEGTDKILIAEVMRKVHCIDYDGNCMWNFETEGHIFSSFLFNQIHDDVKIIFGSHDKKLRCLNYNINQETKVSLEWEIELQSQIYGTPKMLVINDKMYVVSCSTNGYINLINLHFGSLENAIKLPGEIFSSPLIYKNIISVGCRDNFIYCFKLD